MVVENARRPTRKQRVAFVGYKARWGNKRIAHDSQEVNVLVMTI